MATPSTPPQDGAAAEERRQEALLWEKYGALAPKLPPRLAKKQSSKKCFDSADWSMSEHQRRQGGSPQQQAAAGLADLLGLRQGSTELLPAKLSPSPPRPRRLSNLGDK